MEETHLLIINLYLRPAEQKKYGHYKTKVQELYLEENHVSDQIKRTRKG